MGKAGVGAQIGRRERHIGDTSASGAGDIPGVAETVADLRDALRGLAGPTAGLLFEHILELLCGQRHRHQAVAERLGGDQRAASHDAGRVAGGGVKPRTWCTSHRCLGLRPKQPDPAASTYKSWEAVQTDGANSASRGRTNRRVALCHFRAGFNGLPEFRFAGQERSGRRTSP